MHTLLLRLAGPLQSWGTQSRFSIRDGGTEPSKSGVIGLVCAALGRARDEPVDDLAALRLGVRVDREGLPAVDFQTALKVAQAHGKGHETRTSRRHYLADADFLVGLEGDDLALLQRIQDALDGPRWQLFLGRKGYVPGLPVWLPDGLKANTSLEEALAAYSWSAPASPALRQPEQLRLVLESVDGRGGDVRRDQPVGAAFATRTFATRSVETTFLKEIPVRHEEPADVPLAPATEPA